MSNLTFKQFVTALNENNEYCDFIKDPKLRKQCKKLMKKTPGNITYGGGPSGSGSGPGAGTGGGAGPGNGTGGGAFGGPAGGGGASGGGGGGGA